MVVFLIKSSGLLLATHKEWGIHLAGHTSYAIGTLHINVEDHALTPFKVSVKPLPHDDALVTLLSPCCGDTLTGKPYLSCNNCEKFTVFQRTRKTANINEVGLIEGWFSFFLDPLSATLRASEFLDAVEVALTYHVALANDAGVVPDHLLGQTQQITQKLKARGLK